MSAYPTEHVPTREQVLTRLAQKVRARLEVTEAELDHLGVLLDSVSEYESEVDCQVYNALAVRFDALTEVLGIIEEERRQ